MRRAALSALVTLTFVLVWAALRPAAASAHANLVSSDPPAQSSLTRAPDQVQLVFSEAVEPRFMEVSVLDKDRKQVDKGDAHLAPGSNVTVLLGLGDLPQGVYTISWHMVSAVDGHETRGLIPFSVGDPGAVPDAPPDVGSATTETSSLQSGPVGAAARWLMLLSMLALGGLAVSVPLLLRPAGACLARLRGDRDAGLTVDAPERVVGATHARVVRLCWYALAAFAVGSALLLLVDTAAAQGGSLIDAVGKVGDTFRTRRGVEWLVRGGLAVIFAAVLWLAASREAPGKRRDAVWWGLAALVSAMLLATSLGSHSASLNGDKSLNTLVDWIHLNATAVWIGGLIFLGLAFLPSLGPLGGPARTRLLAFLVPRFSTIALASVGVIVLTGLFQTWKLLDGLSALRDLEWGNALIIKLLLVLGLVGLGAINLLLIRPRLDRYAASTDRPTRERAAVLRSRFRRVVLAEVGLGAVILLVVGVLTGVSPTPGSAANGIEGPFRPFVLDQAVEGVKGRLVLSPGRIGNNRFDFTVNGPDGNPMPADTEVLLRFSTLDQDTGTTETKMDAIGPGRFTTSGSFLSTVGLWEIDAVVRQPLKDDVVIPFQLSLTESTGKPQVQEKKPAAPLARGREIYQQNCVQCHGTAARGDGPLAATLRPPPVDLTVHVPLHSDQELEGWITNGIPRTSMPAWGGQFSPEEIQAVINYLREVAKQSGQDR
jgi:copper transport protein